jgi:hypothetical protein
VTLLLLERSVFNFAFGIKICSTEDQNLAGFFFFSSASNPGKRNDVKRGIADVVGSVNVGAIVDQKLNAFGIS